MKKIFIILFAVTLMASDCKKIDKTAIANDLLEKEFEANKKLIVTATFKSALVTDTSEFKSKLFPTDTLIHNYFYFIQFREDRKMFIWKTFYLVNYKPFFKIDSNYYSTSTTNKYYIGFNLWIKGDVYVDIKKENGHFVFINTRDKLKYTSIETF